MSLVEPCFVLSALGALLWLDRAYAFQFMINRPIVAAPLLGLLLGNPEDGLLVGIMLELLWVHYLPVGSTVPPDETTLAVLVTSVGSLNLDKDMAFPHADILYGFAVFLPFAFISQRLDMRLRAFNSRFNRQAEDAIRCDDFRRLELCNWRGLLIGFVSFFVLLLISSLACLSLIQLTFPLLPSLLLHALHLMAYLVPLIGIASALNSTAGMKSLGLFAGSFILFFLILK